MPSRLWGITPRKNVAPTLVLALAAICGAADFTGMAQADDPPPRRILVRLNSDLLVPLIERPIEEVQAVDEMILGVRMIGKAQVAGHPKLTLADDPKHAAFSVTITGTIHSRTTGRNGPVQIHSRSTTQFVATKRVAYQPGRGFVGGAAKIVAQTSSRPERIAPNQGGIVGRAIERRAWVRAAQSREQVNQIIQSKAEVKIRQSFDRLLEERLASFNQLAEQRYLVAAVFGVPRYDCWTIGGWLNIAVSSADDSSSDSPQALEMTLNRYATLGPDGPTIQIWVHERVLGEPLAVLLRHVDLARQLLGQLIVASQAAAAPEVALLSQPSPPGSYDFATIGDWFVLYAGGWNRAKLAIAPAAGAASAPRVADLDSGQ
jgi:hypothetical protein